MNKVSFFPVFVCTKIKTKEKDTITIVVVEAETKVDK